MTIATLAFASPRQTSSGPSTTASFGEVIRSMQPLVDYTFGTGEDRTVKDRGRLAQEFNPYGIAGKTPINQEWNRYQPFNEENFVFTANTLDLTATVPKGGGLFPGGIHSGQICTKQTFQPGREGHAGYAFDVRMKVPGGPGMWPAVWLYTQEPGKNDDSEIDNPEFFNMKRQTEFDWTGSQHGPGQGSELYSAKTSKWGWHPGINFSKDYHSFQTVWTSNAVYKYVDGKLIYAQEFRWTARGPAQLIVNLAVGSSLPELEGLQPTSLAQFPSALSVEYIKIWAN